MEIKFKKVRENAVIPRFATSGSVGADVTACEIEFDNKNMQVTYYTGLAIEIPEGYFADLRCRSSIYKTSLRLTNGLGTIDSDFRGEMKMIFDITPTMDKVKLYEVGDRVGQLVILPKLDIEFVECDSLSETERGEGGHGSTGV